MPSPSFVTASISKDQWTAILVHRTPLCCRVPFFLGQPALFCFINPFFAPWWILESSFPVREKKKPRYLFFYICNANLSWSLRSSGYCVPVTFNYLAPGLRHFQTSEFSFCKNEEAVGTRYRDPQTSAHKHNEHSQQESKELIFLIL